MKYGVGIVSNQPLPRVVEQVKLAEDLGYESVWMIDSQLNLPGAVRDANGLCLGHVPGSSWRQGLRRRGQGMRA